MLRLMLFYIMITALKLVFNNIKNNGMFDERFIKEINQIINKNIKEIEEYRKVQVFIQGSEHIPPKPEQITNLMNYFVYNYNNDINDIYTKIAQYHIQFESIHPFEDGNGRNNMPPIVISKDERVRYFEFLRNKDTIGMANWFKELSKLEESRLNEFGFCK